MLRLQHKLLITNGLEARVGIGQGQGIFFKIHYPAITTSPPEANSLITNERQ